MAYLTGSKIEWQPKRSNALIAQELVGLLQNALDAVDATAEGDGRSCVVGIYADTNSEDPKGGASYEANDRLGS
jgi:hypothetical protein